MPAATCHGPKQTFVAWLSRIRAVLLPSRLHSLGTEQLRAEPTQVRPLDRERSYSAFISPLLKIPLNPPLEKGDFSFLSPRSS